MGCRPQGRAKGNLREQQEKFTFVPLGAAEKHLHVTHHSLFCFLDEDH